MRLFVESGESLQDQERAELEAATRRFFTESRSATSRSWVAEVDDRVVAVGTVALFARPPYPGNLEGSEAYLLNMYTLPEYRKRGLAKAILRQAMLFAESAGFKKIWLHTTAAGRRLYESCGFRGSDSYLEWTATNPREVEIRTRDAPNSFAPDPSRAQRF